MVNFRCSFSNSVVYRLSISFISGDSCVLQLLSIIQKMHESCNCNPPEDVRGVFLDISKVFNKVWHEELVFYLYVLIIPSTRFRVNPLYSCLNVKELVARNRRDIWRLSDCNGTRTHDHLVRKRAPNHLAKLAKWLNCVVNTYLYVAFNCMFLSCHVLVLEWISDKYSQHISIIWPVWLNCLSVRLQTKWLWFWVPLQSLKLQISRLFWARSSLTLRHL